MTAPLISGQPNAGQALIGEPGEWSGSDLTFSYQWQRCNSAGTSCTNIEDATEASYQLSVGDIEDTLRIVVIASNEAGSVTETSAASPVIGAAGTLSSTAAPTIAGVAQSGQKLTASPGSWIGSGTITYGYQWQSCDRYGTGCSDMTGATSAEYEPGSGQVGDSIRVLVTAHDSDGAQVRASAGTQPVSGATSPVSSTPPGISGAAQGRNPVGRYGHLVNIGNPQLQLSVGRMQRRRDRMRRDTGRHRQHLHAYR